MLTADNIRERLRRVRYPGFTRDIVSFGMVKDIEAGAGAVTVKLAPITRRQEVLDAIVADVRRALASIPGLDEVRVEVGEGPRGGQGTDRVPMAGVRDVIAVASGKGGVGKSTVSVNLAVALRELGLRVGLLDADIYGPSVPTMLGLEGARPRTDAERRKVFPIERYGISVISMGFFVDESSPVIWRGPLVMGIVRQFLRDVEWGEQDVVVVDLPPGTGDAPLTLVQEVRVSGGVIVTTPQDVALLDVGRAIAMFRHLETPVIGVIENMSFYECPGCGWRDPVFGEGGSGKVGERFGVSVLGSIPLLPELRLGGDTGQPLVRAEPAHPASVLFRHVAEQTLVAAAHSRAPAPRIV